MIRAIETRYAGCRFRSRLEARWAVFFDALGVRWEYEPQGFHLPSGPYLPDFELFGLGGDGNGYDSLWFEVKPDGQTSGDRDDDRWGELASGTGRPMIVAFGMPRPSPDLAWSSTHPDGWMELYDVNGWDNYRAFAICPACERIGITFEGRPGRVCWHSEDEGKYSSVHPNILAAYEAARSARFEHGEQGAP